MLTGPQSITYEEMVCAIGAVIGRSLHYQEIPLEAAKQGMVAHGFAEGFVESYLARLGRAVGQPAFVSAEVEKILGRPALTFAEWVTEHAAAFRN